MSSSYQSGGLHFCDVSAGARFAIVPLEGATMGEWYALQSDKPCACINGSLYKGDWRRPIGTVIYGGELASNAGNGFGFGVVASGELHWGSPWERKWNSYLSGYPGLIKDGKALEWGFYDKAVFDASTRRSGIAQKGGRVYFVTSGNLTLRQFRDKLLALGMEQAINLDGGGSSRMLHEGIPVNAPTDNRRVANLIAAWDGTQNGAQENAPERGRTMKAICNRKMETYDAAGKVENGRYIAKGDVCTIDSTVTNNLLIGVTYPVSGGTRRAYVKNLAFFTRG